MRIIVLFLAVILASCRSVTESIEVSPDHEAPADTRPVADISGREREVMRAMLDQEAQGKHDALLVISDHSSADIVLDSLEMKAVGEIDEATVREFKRINGSSYRWPTELWTGYRVHALTPTESKNIWRDRRGWDRFYEMFPGSHGHTTLSRPAFSADGNLALVYRGCQAEWLAGGGHIYVLRHKAGKWVITDERIGSEWISQNQERPNKGAAGNAVGRLAVCGVKRFGDRAVTPHANRCAGMSRASASGLALKVLLRSAPPRARA